MDRFVGSGSKMQLIVYESVGVKRIADGGKYVLRRCLSRSIETTRVRVRQSRAMTNVPSTSRHGNSLEVVTTRGVCRTLSKVPQSESLLGRQLIAAMA